MTEVFWTALGFLLGAMPFSVWLCRLLLHTDVRRYGDGNPGGINAWRAGGWRTGLPVLFLDYLKGAVPVGLAHFAFGLSGWWLVPVAVAPVLGHAFSPFLGLRGGKALAATFGVWTGLTLGEGPMFLGLFMGLFYLMQTVDAWAAILGMVGLLAYLLLRQAGLPLLVIWGGNMAIVTWKHRRDLRERPHPRPFLVRSLRPRR
jgi:glycerol-3-phosphate acyltransferase PlsY